MTIRDFLFSCLCLSVAFSCNRRPDNAIIASNSNPVSIAPQDEESVATFASGCFWCAEEIFQSLPGVREVISGYAGGTAEDASYDKVSRGETDHAESVQVYYDSTVITFDLLVDAFFDGHDPTTINQQGPDVGRQYRSIAFYRNELEKDIIQNEILHRDTSGVYESPIITEVTAFTAFYPAEAYHQDYISNNPDDPYVRSVSKPRFEKFKESYEGKLKQE